MNEVCRMYLVHIGVFESWRLPEVYIIVIDTKFEIPRYIFRGQKLLILDM